ncbi:30S ribosomal protein S21 [bacterium]|nr:30S ribosomal protein S21 [bacterium]|tara:strand:- start:10722 stop:10946 length:225 start_codon:yes stop_codon:yes gene_type:complete
MTQNVEVTKTTNESNVSLLRRFSKRLRSSGVLKRARSRRFASRPESRFKRKARALKRVIKTKEIEKLKKLGQIQ